MILTQHSIQLKFNNHTSQPFFPANGCCQGCPLSMLLYVIYNAPLIRIANPNDPNECIVSFVDDTTLLARGKDFKKAHRIIKNMMECTNGVFEWSSTYNSPLEMNKHALINFTQSATKAGDATILKLRQKIQGTTHMHPVKASPNAKLLGVILDARLSWTAQHERVHEKAVKWTAAFKRFTKPVISIPMKEAQKLYNAIAVPKICYAADIWFTPSGYTKADTHHTGPIGITSRLKSIQHQVAISITGAMQTAPGDTMIINANLTPIGIQLKDTSIRAYLQLASCPNHHPITRLITRTHTHQVRHHRMALHHLASISSINPGNLEKIRTQRYKPSDRTPFRANIAEMKEESIKWDKENFNRGMKIYTDGSGQKGVIGAAAILYINSTKRGKLYHQLGTARQHTVFEGELVALILGLHLAKEHIKTYPDINISINNQAAIKSIGNNRAQPAQYIIDEIKSMIRELVEEGQCGNHNNCFINTPTSITLTWVAGHMNSLGNEAVDKLAKAATKFGSSSTNLLPQFLRNNLPISVSATKQHIKTTTKNKTCVGGNAQHTTSESEKSTCPSPQRIT